MKLEPKMISKRYMSNIYIRCNSNIVNIPENFHVFGNFFWKMFGGYRKMSYLCTRKSGTPPDKHTKELLDQREKDKFTWISESREKSRPKGVREFFERFT